MSFGSRTRSVSVRPRRHSADLVSLCLALSIGALLRLTIPHRQAASGDGLLLVVTVGWAVDTVGLQRLVVGKAEVAHQDVDAGVAHQLLQRADVSAVA